MNETAADHGASSDLSALVDPRAANRPSPLAHSRDVLTRRALVVSDITVTAVIVWVALAALGSDHIKPGALLLLLPIPIIAKLLGLYDNDDTKLRHTTLDEAPRVLALAATMVVGIWLFERSIVSGEVGHEQRLGMAIVLAAVLIVGRGVTRRLVTAALPPERCIVAGLESDSKELAERFERSHTFKARVIERVELDSELTADAFEGRERIRDLVRDNNAERLIVIPRSADDLEIARAANSIGVKVSVIPRLFDTIGASFTLDDLIGLTLLGMRRPRLTGSSTVVKRTFDLILGLLITILLAPVMLIIAIAVKLDSPGPAIYKQRRVGKDELSFTIYKFRSMSDGSHGRRSHLKNLNEADGLFKITDDPRITRVGRLIRKTSLDELPQIFNVLKGEMSLVGPRPLVPEEDLLLSGWARFRYRVLPGMTGPWQLGTASRFSIEDMASLDYVYVTNWSLWTDIKILIRTAVYVLGLHGR